MFRIEFDMLLYLAKNINKIIIRKSILSRAWQQNSDPQTNIVDVYISKLCKKLSQSDIVIQTVRGNDYHCDGYRLSIG